jgi:hypothetical protein
VGQWVYLRMVGLFISGCLFFGFDAPIGGGSGVQARRCEVLHSSVRQLHTRRPGLGTIPETGGSDFRPFRDVQHEAESIGPVDDERLPEVDVTVDQNLSRDAGEVLRVSQFLR